MTSLEKPQSKTLKNAEIAENLTTLEPAWFCVGFVQK